MATAFKADAFQTNAFQIDAGGGGGGGPTPAAAATPVVFDRGSADFVIDPITRDFIDTTDGEWLVSTDSRSAVLHQLEIRLFSWWGDPQQGSRCRDVIAGDFGGTIEDVKDAALLALQALINEGIIADLAIVTDKDETGRDVLLLSYTDQSSGRLVDLAYVPFGG